jgi:methionyl aminopeptidase
MYLNKQDPTNAMDKEIVASLTKAGAIAHQALHFGGSQIKVGTPLVEVCDAVEKKIISLGGQIAFPAQISLNQVAAHYCPTEEDTTVFSEGDLAKIDIGVHINGYIADTALTVNLGDHDAVTKASAEALSQALKVMHVGVSLGEIGRNIQEVISSHGFSPIRNLSGHGLDRFMVHTAPSIPNFDTHEKVTLQEDMFFACEPFATTGKGSIFESTNPTVFALVAKKPVRSTYARELLPKIESFQGLPFTTRWLTREFGKGKTILGLKELVNNGSVREYPPLPEVTKGFVSQAEHSILFNGTKKHIYTQADE